MKTPLFSAAVAALVAIVAAAPDFSLSVEDKLFLDSQQSSSLVERDDAHLPLTKRACKYNGCTCASGANGLYCGMCNQVTGQGSGGKFTEDVYQCGRGTCCDYGYRASCDYYKVAGHNVKPCGG